MNVYRHLFDEMSLENNTYENINFIIYQYTL